MSKRGLEYGAGFSNVAKDTRIDKVQIFIRSLRAKRTVGSHSYCGSERGP